MFIFKVASLCNRRPMVSRSRLMPAQVAILVLAFADFHVGELVVRQSPASSASACVRTSLAAGESSAPAAHLLAFWFSWPCHASIACSPYSPMLPNQSRTSSAWQQKNVKLKGGAKPWKSVLQPCHNREHAWSIGGSSSRRCRSSRLGSMFLESFPTTPIPSSLRSRLAAKIPRNVLVTASLFAEMA